MSADSARRPDSANRRRSAFRSRSGKNRQAIRRRMFESLEQRHLMATLSYWQFDDAAAGTAANVANGVVDSVGGHHGTGSAANGAPASAAPQYSASVPGVRIRDGIGGPLINSANDTSLRFTNTGGVDSSAGSLVTVADHPDFWQQDFTIEGFVLINSSVNFPTLVGKSRSGGTSLELDTGNNNSLRVRVDHQEGSGPGFNQGFTSSGTVLDGQWHHFAVTFAQGSAPGVPGTVRIYRDYVLTGSGSLSSGHSLLIYDNSPLFFGSNSGGRALDGWLDEIRYSSGVLTPSQFLVATSSVPETLYVNDDFSSGSVDGNAELAGNQPAYVGVDAFASVNAALAAYPNFSGNIVVNGGTYGAVDLTGGGNVTLQLVRDNVTNVTFENLIGDAGDSIVTRFHGVADANLIIQQATSTQGTFAGVISGAGGLTKGGAGTLTLSGGAANTYTGLTTVASGTLMLNKTAGVNAIGGDVSLTGGDLRFMKSDQIVDTANVSLSSSSSDLNGSAPNVGHFFPMTETFATLTVTSGSFTPGMGSVWNITGAASFTGGAGKNSIFVGNSGTRVNFGSLSLTDMTGIAGGNPAAANNFTIHGAQTQETVVTVGSGGLTLNNSILNMRRGDTADKRGSRLILNGDVNVVGTATSSIVEDTGGGFNGVLNLELSGTAGNVTRNFNISSTLLVGVRVTNGAASEASLTQNGGVLGYVHSQNNTYTGVTTVNNGRIALNKTADKTAIPGDLTLNNGIVSFGGENINQIADTATVTLNGANSILNGTSVNMGAGNVTETFANLIVNGGVFTPGVDGIWTITGEGRFTGGAGQTTFIGNSGSRTSFGTLTLNNLTSTPGAVVEGTRNAFTLFGNSASRTSTITVGSGGLNLNNAVLNLRQGTVANAKGSRIILNGNVNTTGSNSVSVIEDEVGGNLGELAIQLGGAGVSVNPVFNIGAGADLTVAVPITNGVAADGTAEPGTPDGLTKSGPGTLTLNAFNTFTGNVTVSGGVAKLGTRFAFGPANTAVTKVVVTPGGTVDFNGIVDAAYGYTIAGTGATGAGALVNNGAAIGNNNLQMHNLRLAADATIGGTGNFALLAASYGPTTLDLNGHTLTKAGTNTFTIVNATITSGSIHIASGTVAQSQRAHDASNVAFSLNNAAGASLDLGGFDLAIGSLSGGGAAGGSVALGAQRLTIGGLDTSTTYAGIVSGTGGLTKVGTGTLTLSAANTFSGAMQVNEGVARVGNNRAFGAANPSPTKVVVASGAAVDFNGVNDAHYGYTIAGVGPNGQGALTNTGATIDNGKLQASNITLAGDASIGGIGSYALLAPGYGPTTLDLAGHTLTKLGANTFTLANATITAGSIHISGGTLSQFVRAHDASLVDITLDNTAGVALDLGGFDLTVGSLAGGGAAGGNVLLGSHTLTVGGLGDSTSYAGTISGSGSVTKVGSGALALTGANTYTGATNVDSGILLANNSSGSATGSGLVTVAANGTLGGVGTIAGPVTVNGTLAPGASAAVGTIGTLNVGGTLTLASTSVYQIDANAGSNDRVNATNIAIQGGTLNANVPAGLPLGTELVILDAGVATTGQFNVGTASLMGDRQLQLGGEIYFLTNGDPANRFAGIEETEVALVRNRSFTVGGETSFTINEDGQQVYNLVDDLDGDAVISFTQPGAGRGAVAIDPVTGILTYTPPADFSGTATFSYSITDGEFSVGPTTVTINVTPVADMPDLTINGQTNPAALTLQVTENTPLNLAISGLLKDTNALEQPETLSITIEGFLPDVVLTVPGVGTFSGSTSYSFTGADLTGLASASLSKPDNEPGNAPFTLTVTATATESALPSSIASRSATVQVTVANAAPVPVQNAVLVAGNLVTPASGNQLTVTPGTPVTFRVSASDLVANQQDKPYRFTLTWAPGVVQTQTVSSLADLVEFTYDFAGVTPPEAFTPILTVAELDSGNPIDGDSALATIDLTQINISTIALIDGTLYVGGTSDSDRIVLTKGNNSKITVRFNNKLHSNFDVTEKVVVYGNEGADTITVSGAISAPVEFYGGAGNDYLAGSTWGDILDGGDDNDRLLGGGGNDTVLGGGGHDTLAGGAGDDYLSGDGYLDLIGEILESSSPGRDELTGEGGADILIGGGGSDELNGGLGADQLLGGDGDDVLDGGDGKDLLAGEAGSDKLYGRGGNDVLVGGDDGDSIYGAAGADLIYGGLVDNSALLDLWMLWSAGNSANQTQAFADLDAAGIDDAFSDLLDGEGDDDWYIVDNDTFRSSAEKRNSKNLIDRP